MKRRVASVAFALVCALAQVVAGASSAAGLVLCVAQDHTGIESSASGCCAGHQAERTDGAKLEESCCSDTPFSVIAPPTSDVSKSPSRGGAVLVGSSVVVPPVPPRAGGRSVPDLERSASARLALRSVILRV